MRGWWPQGLAMGHASIERLAGANLESLFISVLPDGRTLLFLPDYYCTFYEHLLFLSYEKI
jgi:hypothetical protein